MRTSQQATRGIARRVLQFLGRDKRRTTGLIFLATMALLFLLHPASVGALMFLFPIALIVNSKKPAMWGAVLIGICLMFCQFMGARVYGLLTGIVGMGLALFVIHPLSQFGAGLLIAIIGTYLSLRITWRHP